MTEENKLKNEQLDKNIQEGFASEKERHIYGKKPKTSKWQYLRPALFIVILSVTLTALFINIHAAISYFLSH